MIQVRLSNAVRAYLLNETAYLRARSIIASQRFQSRFRELRRNLAKFPQMGFAREDFPRRGVRRIIMDDYILDYRIKDDILEILSIRHGRQAEIDLPLEDHTDFEA